MNSPVPFIIIRYPKEKEHALNTVNILQVNLKNIYIFDTENADNHLPFIELLKKFRHPILIYKSEQSKELNFKQDKGPIQTTDALILIDGTWKKTFKIYSQSKILQSLPIYHFKTDTPSQYQLRKTTKDSGLSTLETVYFLLNKKEAKKEWDLLLEPFLKMINIQILKFEEKKKKKGSD
jgi:DTW domain-containing protein YfiP